MKTSYLLGNNQRTQGTSVEVKVSPLPEAQECRDANKGKTQLVQREELMSVKSPFILKAILVARTILRRPLAVPFAK